MKKWKSGYDKWVELGKPDEYSGKAGIVVQFWKTNPTKIQREIVTRWVR